MSLIIISLLMIISLIVTITTVIIAIMIVLFQSFADYPVSRDEVICPVIFVFALIRNSMSAQDSHTLITTSITSAVASSPQYRVHWSACGPTQKIRGGPSSSSSSSSRRNNGYELVFAASNSSVWWPEDWEGWQQARVSCFWRFPGGVSTIVWVRTCL